MGAFGLGVLQGFATSTDEALKTHIKDNKDRFDKNLEAALSRNLERSTRYDKKSREAQEALELVGGLTDGDLGRASEIIQGIGGVGQVQGFVDSFRKARQVDPNINLGAVVKYAESEGGNLTPQQAIDQILKPFEFTVPAQAPRREGLAGLFDDPRSMAVELPKTLRERGLTSRGADDIIRRQGATIDWSKLRTPEQTIALRKSQAEIKGLEDANRAREISIHTKIKEFGYMDKQEQDRIATVSAQLADTRASTKVRLQALKTAREFDAPKARAAIEASVAASIESRSSDDMAEQYNLLGTEERYYNDQLSQQKEDSNKYYRTARRLTDIRLARGKLLATGLTTPGDDTFSNVNVISAANAIKADAVRDAGLKYKLDVHGRIQILKGGTADKVYQASRNAYTNFRKSFGQANAPQVRQQLAAMQQSMYNAQSTYVSNAVGKHFKNIKPIGTGLTADARKKLIAENKKIHDTLPKSHIKKTFEKDGVGYVAMAMNMQLLNTLKPGTLILINSQAALKENWDLYKESGNFAIWDGSALIQRKKNPNENKMPTYHPAQSAFSR